MINELLKSKWLLAMLLLAVIAVSAVTVYYGSNGQESDVQVEQQATVNENDQKLTDAAENTEPGYYFVQENEGKVNVYWCEGNEKQLYRETGIEFSMLGLEDQELLKTGIKLGDEQELASFLENFDS